MYNECANAAHNQSEVPSGYYPYPPNTKYAKGVLWLAELYGKKQVSGLTAQTLNKAVEYEVSQSQAQLAEIQKVLSEYEKQFNMSTAAFFERYQAGQTDDSAESVEWASLAQMAESLRKRLDALTGERRSLKTR